MTEPPATPPHGSLEESGGSGRGGFGRWYGRFVSLVTLVDRLGRTEERLSKVAERLEERVRRVEDGLLKLATDAEGLERIVVAKASADAQTAAARTVLDRLERVFDRLAHIEAQLPPRPLPPGRQMDRRD